MLHALLAFAVLFVLVGIFSLTLAVVGKARIMQPESPGDDSMLFSKLFGGGKTLLSFLYLY